MKKAFFIGWLIVLFPGYSSSQEISSSAEQQLEELTATTENETEDDSYWTQLEQFRKHPLNLNTAGDDELKQLGILNAMQLDGLLNYRRLLGRLIDLHELQAVPGWDLPTIKKLIPFITIAMPFAVRESMRVRMKKGDHTLLLRASQVLEKAEGYRSNGGEKKYPGSPQRLFLRYRYNYKNLLQYGCVADKDAGERFFGGVQRYGFDFYSFHLFARQMGTIQALAIGDFTVNMGQGLIQWQSLAFRKSAETMNMERQSAVLNPYNAAGEYNFHRGIGATLRKGSVEATAFLSLRKMSSSLDTAAELSHFSSFQLSGNHRTVAEVTGRNNLGQMAFGGVARYRKGKWRVGLNGVYYRFSFPLQKRDEPYNLYALAGDAWYNVSADYSYTYKNFHFFGEVAGDRYWNTALLSGLLISADRRVDLSLLYRRIDKKYQAVNGNAFTENSTPSNENGLYAGITVGGGGAWKLNAFADIYSFPWLKYLVDAPGRGADFLAQLIYTPNKQAEISARFRNETREGNGPEDNSTLHDVTPLTRQGCRVQCTYKINKELTWRNRVEMVWFNYRDGDKEAGFLANADLLLKPMMRPYSAGVRLQYFETGGYNSRLYTYENDVLFGYSIPVFFDNGYRYYINLSYDLTKKIICWVRWAQTLYQGKKSIGTGNDAIEGSSKTELKAQLLFNF